MDRKRVVAIIPARGGSKRIPHKNIVEFDGKPLIAWTIQAARESGLFDRIVASTDDPAIADVARQHGADVPFLRDAHADDISPVSEATLRTLVQLEEQGDVYDEVVQLFSVCPLRSAEDMREALAAFRRRKVPFQISCFQYGWMNPWWAVTMDDMGRPSPIFEDTRVRSQDLPPLYCPTGAIWIARVEALKREATFYGQGHVFWEMDWRRAVDIDTLSDLVFAKALKLMNVDSEA